ncbi:MULTISPECIES: nucleotidyltransferase domain-containing protein [unclassified Methanobrevibacter]|uniref:nucleotidyltransferase domain-containing protein n=1 Tax=unclassified Methanobrevibacter TaxID=2638681 RepID=UPI002736F894|nr:MULTISPECIES: nucleotidyltransferase domain-containing protein [unclassified Methanobrevibacter]
MNDRIEIAKEFANTIKSDYVKSIMLFGSVARGDDTEESDIDILIISNHHMEIDDKIADAVAWIMYDKGELISAHVMSEEHFNKTKSYSFLTNVLREGVVIG